VLWKNFLRMMVENLEQKMYAKYHLFHNTIGADISLMSIHVYIQLNLLTYHFQLQQKKGKQFCSCSSFQFEFQHKCLMTYWGVHRVMHFFTKSAQGFDLQLVCITITLTAFPNTNHLSRLAPTACCKYQND
jgi:hypothetical protein